jgi:hypothetical protein
VKQVGDLAGEEPVVPEASQEVGLVLRGGGVEARPGGGPLGEHLPELPELQEAGARVLGEVALGERAEVVQQPVMHHQEREVR